MFTRPGSAAIRRRGDYSIFGAGHPPTFCPVAREEYSGERSGCLRTFLARSLPTNRALSAWCLRSCAPRGGVCVWTDASGQVTLGCEPDPVSVVDGVAGFTQILREPVIIAPGQGPRHPRTALGVSQNRIGCLSPGDRICPSADVSYSLA